MRDGYQLVGAVLIERAGRLLVVQEGKEAVRGTWNLPAGKIEDDEDPRSGAEREAMEETGLAVETDHLIGIYLGHSDLSDRRVVNMVYHATAPADAEPSSPTDDTVLGVAWVRPERLEALELRARYIQAAVTDWRDGQRLEPGTVTDLTR